MLAVSPHLQRGPRRLSMSTRPTGKPLPHHARRVRQMLWTKIVTTSDRGRPSRSPPESQPQSSPSTHLASDDAGLADPVRRHARILLRLAPAIAPGSAVFSASGRSGSSSFPPLPWVRSRSPSHPLNPARHRPDHRRPRSRDSEPLPPCSRCSSKSAPSIQAVWKGSEYPAVVWSYPVSVDSLGLSSSALRWATAGGRKVFSLSDR